ncbi:MAG: nitroreductase family protein [Candidatus Methanoperedens sp.]|nr:nitroreductase family protein [Candidatus Methanoperedens sp.]
MIAASLLPSIQWQLLPAVEEGLGTCWIGAFDEERVKQILGIPGEVRVVSLLTLGYPSDVLRPKSRKSLDEAVMWS